MSLSLRIVAALLLAGLSIACGENAIDEMVLERAGYGPDAWTRQRMLELGRLAYLDEQLDPTSIPDLEREALEAAYPVLDMNYRELRESGLGGWEILQQTSRAKLTRAVHSRRQLEAVLIDFWFNHFSVYAGEGLAAYDLPVYERQAIAPHVLGRFEDMLVAVAQSPAMLDYLDNDESSVWGLNENYARELMELHTLGVDGPYTEQDVQEVARCFTGWTTSYDGSESETGFLYRENWHDPDAKVVLGVDIPAGGGMQDGLDVLAILARHPSTAEFVSRKLVRRFVAEDPPEALVQRLAAEWLATDGDLHAVTRMLLYSVEFQLARMKHPPKVKRPLVFAASLARALELSGDDVPGMLMGDSRSLGEAMFRARPPTGYPESSLIWSGNGTLLGRFNIAYSTVQGWRNVTFPLDETGTPEEIVDALGARLFVNGASPRTRQAGLDYIASLPAYVQNNEQRVAEELLALLLASPEFLTH